MFIILMGVSGCGKSTLGKAMAESLEIPFYDGDDYHPKSNICKMTNGIPLNDADRAPWLQTLRDLMTRPISSTTVNPTANVTATNIGAGRFSGIVACSALKAQYRRQLVANVNDVVFVHLKVSLETAQQRLMLRKGHFFDVKLLRNQFDSLEEMTNDEGFKIFTIQCDDTKTNERILHEVLEKLPSFC